MLNQSNLSHAGSRPKVLLIGLDCAEPSLVFERWRKELPNLSAMMDSGLYGPLLSTVPPVTVPAWASMLTSKDPGQLGLYGFRNRKDHSYDNMSLASSVWLKEKTLDQILSRQRLTSILLGVPLTYPPRPLRGLVVSGPLTPSKDVSFTYPPELQTELDAAAGGCYIIDVPDFRTEDKDRLLRDIYEMTRARFNTAVYLTRNKPWDFFMMVEMGIDRIHHGFWRHHDRNHRLYQPGNPYENAIRDYYRFIDDQIGKLMEYVPHDTLILVASDHGAKTMRGGFAINQWLIKNGLLSLKEALPEKPVRLFPDMVDWPRTSAWGEGGYYGRLFLNVKGREPQGVVPAGSYEELCGEISRALEAEVDDQGEAMGNQVFRADSIYRQVRNVAPDLIVYFGGLDWRSLGSVGREQPLYAFENDTGPDDANHAQEGLLIMTRQGEQKRLPSGRRSGLTLYDIAPTILNHLKLPVPEDMIGRVID